MLRPQPTLRSTPSFSATCDQSINVCRQLTASLHYSSLRLPFSSKLKFRHRKTLLTSCKSSRSNQPADYSDHEFLQASVMLPETTTHYQMLTRGFRDETTWHPAAQIKDSRANINSIGSGFLRRFQSPTIFLKSSCDGDYVLPIIVGEYAVEKLVDFSTEDDSWGCPNQFQLVRNLVEKLGYKVMMVRITERVHKTYFARIIFCKPGENDILSVDARPSDAINVASRCQAPIYVNKQIVLTDGILISFGMGRVRDSKPTYDVLLDSADDGPNILAEELQIVQNMNLAVEEERYDDAVMWREKLTKLRDSHHGF